MERAWKVLGTIALAAMAACQLAGKEPERRRRTAPGPPPPALAAPDAAAEPVPGTLPSPAPAEPAVPAGPDEASALPPRPPGTVGVPTPPPADEHCPEPPEVGQARANMARMAEERRDLAEKLGVVRSQLLAFAKKLLDRRPWEEIRATAADFATTAGSVPGWRPVSPDLLEAAIRETALFSSACRSLGPDPSACRTASGLAQPGGPGCEMLAGLLSAGRRLAQGELADPARAAAGRPTDPEQREAGAAALFGGDVAACERWRERSGGATDLQVALCLAVAGRDLAPCDGLPAPRGPSTCRLFAGWLLATLGKLPAADPATAEDFRRLDGLASGTDCETTAMELLASDRGVAAALVPEPLIGPDVERERGLAPP
ncbi:MAG: hypothetical protein HY907_14740 [Deltaproteobacteria bacterium]|nr:hypothetical protein [Deltaproteobacteria bacterium]